MKSVVYQGRLLSISSAPGEDPWLHIVSLHKTGSIDISLSLSLSLSLLPLSLSLFPPSLSPSFVCVCVSYCFNFFILLIFLSIYLFIYLFIYFWSRVSLCSFGCPETHSLDQASFEFRYLPASACLHLLGARIKGMPHHLPAAYFNFYCFTIFILEREREELELYG